MCLRASIMQGLWSWLSPLADAARIISRAMGTIKRYFLKLDERSLCKGLPTHVNRLIQRRSLTSLPRAVCLRQRHSNNAYMGSMSSRSLRR
jgi:hypothetical protein